MDQQVQLQSGTYPTGKRGGVSDFTEACAELLCTMETLISVPAVEAVKDEAV